MESNSLLLDLAASDVPYAERKSSDSPPLLWDRDKNRKKQKTMTGKLLFSCFKHHSQMNHCASSFLHSILCCLS